jgi:integrase
VTRGSPSFRDFCEKTYEPHAEAHLRASTWKTVRVYQIATLCRHLGDLRLSEIQTKHVEAFKIARMREVRPSSANNELRVLRTVLGYAKTLGYSVAAPTIKKLPTPGGGRVKLWTADQIDRLFEAARVEAPEILPLLIFLANTGCRKGEGIAAEWSWIDWERDLVSIPVNEVWRPKSGRPREVPLSRAVKAALAGPRAHERWLFPSRQGGRYACFPEELWRRVRDAAKLEGGPHQLRHTYASHFLAAVPDMFLLAQVLGHSHTRISELYSHLLPGHLERAKNAVDLAPRVVLATVGTGTMAETMAAGSKSSKKSG